VVMVEIVVIVVIMMIIMPMIRPNCQDEMIMSMITLILMIIMIFQKQVSSSATMRDCATLTTSYKCLNPSSDNYVCTSDLCNTANRDGSRIAIATLMTSLIAGVMIIRFF